MAKPTELIGSAEACRILDIDKATLLRWIVIDRIRPAHKLPGLNGAYLWRRRDIERLAAERAEESA